MKILRRLKNALFLAGCLYGVCWSLPQGADVTHGNVTIQNAGSTQTITQGSDRAIINWNGFNIDVGELVNIVQPSSISAILNRVVGQDPSVILGQLRANGQVFLVNPNGIVFGDTAQINVGSLVSSTLNITDDDFLRGNLNFEQAPDKALASVINHGTIKIDDNGFLVLTGPMVANEGVILARVGQVALAGGTRSTVSFDPTGMIQVALPEGSSTEKGIVSLTRSATSDLLANVVTTSARPAGQMVVRDGRTFLEVDSGTVVNTGEIRAEGMDGQSGGRIVLDSTGHTLLAPGALVSAAGQGVNSPGGQVYFLSDGQGTTSPESRIDVSGSAGGDGGFLEHSAGYGRIGASMDFSSDGGKGGTLLIDPDRILIVSGSGGFPPDAPHGPYTVTPGTVEWYEDDIEGITTGTILLEANDGVDLDLTTGDGVLAMSTDLTINLIGDGSSGDPAFTSAAGHRIVMAARKNFSLESTTGREVYNLVVETSGGGDISLALGGGDIIGPSSFSAPGGDVGIQNAGFVGSGQPVSITADNIAIDAVNVQAVLPSAPQTLTINDRGGAFDSINITDAGSIPVLTASTTFGEPPYRNLYIDTTADLVYATTGDLLVGTYYNSGRNITLTTDGDLLAYFTNPDLGTVTLEGRNVTGGNSAVGYKTDTLIATAIGGDIDWNGRLSHLISTSTGDTDVNVDGTPDITTINSTAGGHLEVGNNVGTGMTVEHLQADSARLVTGGLLEGSDVTVSTTLDLDAGNIDLSDVNAPTLSVTGVITDPDTFEILGPKTVDASLELTGDTTFYGAVTGDFDLSSTGSLTISELTAGGQVDITLNDPLGGTARPSLDRVYEGFGSHTITGSSVSLTAGNMDVLTETSGLDFTSTGNVYISNSGDRGELRVGPSSAMGDIYLDTDGDLNVANMAGSRIDLDPGTDDGVYTGNITGGTLSAANGMRLYGNVVNVTTQTSGDLYVDAEGDVTVHNDSYDLFGLDISTDGDVDFTTTGHLAITSVRGGDLVSIDALGDITSMRGEQGGEGPAEVQSTGRIVLSAGGTITPTGTPLGIDAFTGLTVTARGQTLGGGGEGGPLLRAMVLAQEGGGEEWTGNLLGNLGVEQVTVGSGSGPINYNNTLLQAPVPSSPPQTTPETPTTPDSPTTPTTPDTPTSPPIVPDIPPVVDVPTTPTPPTNPGTPTPPIVEIPVDIPNEVATTIQTVRDQLGQQQGQLVDDGGSGSAANDGLVEQSPTQQLVARLLESAGGEGLSTEVLLTLEIDEMGEVKVVLADGEKSPTDVRIDTAEDLQADDMLDLDPEEMGDVAVKLYYDPATDQLIMAVDLRADDIIDLDVTEFQEIPINLSYAFLSDPKLLADALRANDIIDLEVEDLGEIPIRVHVESASTGVGSQGAETDSAKNSVK